MTLGRYVVLHFVYVYKIRRCLIQIGDHSTVHIILKLDLPLVFCCLIPMKYIMNHSAYSKHMAKCPSYELLPHWNPLQKCVNTGTRRIKPSFNARQISTLECFFILNWLELKCICMQIYKIQRLGKTDTPKP